MSNRTDIVVETDNAEGQVLLSASRVYDLAEDKTQDTINGEIKNTLTQLETTTAQLDQNMAYVESSNTATRTYTGGEFISWKGTLYTASTGIPMGDPFAVGTNLAAVVDGNGVLCGGLNDIIIKSPIIETANDGTAYKFPNGLMICTKMMTFNNVACTNAWGSCYESQQISCGSWPKTFVGESPIVTVTNVGGMGCWLEYLTNISVSYIGDTYFVRPNSNTASVTVNVIGIGRWK